MGYSTYEKVTPSGINQREQDVYDAFTQVINRIIAIGPDLARFFLITHIEEVKDMMPVVWSVEEVSDGLRTVITEL